MYLKRTFRDFCENKIKYISFFLLITLSVMIIVGFNRAMDSYVKNVEAFFETNAAEDGQFSVYGSVSKRKQASLEGKYGISIEEVKYVDCDFIVDAEGNSISKNENKSVRVFSYERDINTLYILEGEMPNNNGEIVIDPKFAEAQGFSVGDDIVLDSKTFNITGFGITPDYVYSIKNLTDMSVSHDAFGIAYLSNKDIGRIEYAMPETLYCFKGEGGDYEEFRNELQKDLQLSTFVLKGNNPRIIQVFDDANAPRQVSVIIGLLLVIVVSFVIAISVNNTIAAESKTIGIFYAQGFKNSDLLKYYMFLPSITAVLATLLGAVLGIAISTQLTSIQAEYITPPIVMKLSPSIIALGIAAPILLTVAIACISVSRKLNCTPLSLLRGDESIKMPGKIEKLIGRLPIAFIVRFRLKNLAREKSSIAALFFGVTLSVYVLFTAMFLTDSVVNFLDTVENSMPYESMYTFIDKGNLNKNSVYGETTALKEVRFNPNEKMHNIYIQGIDKNTELFDMPEIYSLEDGEVCASLTMHNKFGLSEGDVLEVYDDVEDKSYIVKIAAICNYDYGQYLYTTKEGYNKILGLHSDSSNSLMTQEKLDIDTDKLRMSFNKNDLIDSLSGTLDMIKTLSGIMLWVGSAILICIIVMLIQMNLEKDKNNISMVKMFGYRKKEISILYLSGNIFVLIIGLFCAIPMGYYTTKTMYDAIMENYQQYFLPIIYMRSLIAAFLIMTVSYNVAMYLLTKKLHKIPLTEILKNRE